MSVAEQLLTADIYFRLPASGKPTELVRGKVVTLNVPAPRHGYVCANVARAIGGWAERYAAGRVVTNDSGVVTERNPDTVRGADVSFYSYGRLPQGPVPEGYLTVAPEIIFEVRSPNERWPDILAKVAEYLKVDVLVVCVLDPDHKTAHVYRSDEPVRVLTAGEQLRLPELHGTLCIQVGTLFE